MTIACVRSNYNWRIHASVVVDRVTFMVRSISSKDHTCKRNLKNPEVTSDWIAKKIYTTIKNNLAIGSDALATELCRIFGVGTRKKRLYIAKKKALRMAVIDFTSSYTRLQDYDHILLEKNRETTLKIQQDPIGTFKRMFVSFATQQIIMGCIRFIGMDGCHLKTPYGEVLLNAVTLDANNGIFPLAICVYEGENLDSWSWFLLLLKEHMHIMDGIPITFMSNR